MRWRALAVCLVAGGMTLLVVGIVNVALSSIRTGLLPATATSSRSWRATRSPSACCWSRRDGSVTHVADAASLWRASPSSPLPVLPAGAALALRRACRPEPRRRADHPQISGFIQNLFKGAERGRASGLFGAGIGVSTAIGPLLGGVLVQIGGVDFGWRLVFYVNAPIGLLLILLAARWLPKAEHGRSSRSTRSAWCVWCSASGAPWSSVAWC